MAVKQMSKIVIRKMCEDNLPIVSELAMLANPHILKEEYGKRILDRLKEYPDLSFIAEDDGKVVGYVQAVVYEDEAVIGDIVVANEYQRKGIGKQLMNAMLGAIKNRKVRIILAEIHYKCASSIPFYYKYNFRITGFVQDYFGAGHDVILLRLVMQ